MPRLRTELEQPQGQTTTCMLCESAERPCRSCKHYLDLLTLREESRALGKRIERDKPFILAALAVAVACLVSALIPFARGCA